MTRFLFVCLLGVMTGAAFAQTPAPSDSQPPAVADEAVADEAASDDAASDDLKMPSRFCLQTTGSRIAAAQNLRAEREGQRQRRCAAAAGRVYTRDELERSGHINLDAALRSLDTSIR